MLKTLNEYEVGFENVVAFSSDSASYMVCCFTQVLQPMFENCVQLQCLAHIMIPCTSSESKIFLETIQNAALESYEKFKKYFHKSSGVYGGLTFLHEIEFLYPVKTLSFSESPNLAIFRGVEIPHSEFAEYRRQARNFVSKITADNQFEMEAIKNEVQVVKDFWQSNTVTLSHLKQYGYLVGSSAGVERTISYYNNILTDDRRNFKEENLEKLLFLYFNAGKL